MMIQSLSADHEGSYLLPQCLALQCNFLCFDVIFSGVLGSVLCLQNRVLCPVSFTAITCHISDWKLFLALAASSSKKT